MRTFSGTFLAIQGRTNTPAEQAVLQYIGEYSASVIGLPGQSRRRGYGGDVTQKVGLGRFRSPEVQSSLKIELFGTICW